jgi:DNA-binding CsgD family transcriptional regulator
MTPTLVDKVKRPSRLTERELIVARLASEGHSSKAIARQLAVSVRTVDSHLTRAYQKLGVVSRQELVPILSLSGRAGSDG